MKGQCISLSILRSQTIIATFERQMKLIFFLIQLLCAQETKSHYEKQPNIIFVVADDLGWADVNWNNKETS